MLSVVHDADQQGAAMDFNACYHQLTEEDELGGGSGSTRGWGEFERAQIILVKRCDNLKRVDSGHTRDTQVMTCDTC